MDTPCVAVVHKKNVHIGGGKATVTMKPDKLKSAKTADQKRKALKTLRSVYLRVVGASKDVNLKQKFTIKGNKVKRNQMRRGKQSKSVLQGFGKGNKPFGPITIDEEIKKSSVWAPFRRIFTVEEIKEYYESHKDGMEGIEEIIEEITVHPPECNNPYISREMEIPGLEFEEAFTREEKVYEKKTDEPDFKISDPGLLSSVSTPEELKLGGLDELLLYDYPFLDEYYPLPELKLNDGLLRI